VTADEAAATAGRIFELREGPRAQILLQRPLVNANLIKDRLDGSFPTANRLVARFVEKGLQVETAGQRRSRVFPYDRYLSLFDEPEAAP
jgi:hypothetical protein